MEQDPRLDPVEPATSCAQQQRQLHLARLKEKQLGRALVAQDGGEKHGFDFIYQRRDSAFKETDFISGSKYDNTHEEQDMGRQDSMDDDAGRSSRRARIEAMRARFTKREQVAQEGRIHLNELTVASAVSNAEQSEHGFFSEDIGDGSTDVGHRTALQRRIDHIRLSRATRKEDLLNLKDKEGSEQKSPSRPDIDEARAEVKPPSTARVPKVKQRPPEICTDFDTSPKQQQRVYLKLESTHVDSDVLISSSVMPLANAPHDNMNVQGRCRQLSLACSTCHSETKGFHDVNPQRADSKDFLLQDKTNRYVGEILDSSFSKLRAESGGVQCAGRDESKMPDTVAATGSPISAKVAHPISAAHNRDQADVDSAPQDVFKQVESMECTVDTSHIADVLAARRATMQKLKEKRAARSQLAHAESSSIVEDEQCSDEGGIRDNITQAVQSLQRARKFRNSVENFDEGLEHDHAKEHLLTAATSAQDFLNNKIGIGKTGSDTCVTNLIRSSLVDFSKGQCGPISKSTRCHSSCHDVDVDIPPNVLELSAGPDLHAARIKRIRELQRERACVSMPDATSNTEAKRVGDGDKGVSAKNSHNTLNLKAEDQYPMGVNSFISQEFDIKLGYSDKIDGGDEIISSKKIVSISQVPSRCASVVEPEPESQADNEADFYPQTSDVISMSGHHSLLKLSDVKPPMEMVQSIKVEVDKEDVDEIMNRFDRFCKEPCNQEEPRKNIDTVFEELQGKWRDLRGGMDATDLRPEFKALLVPFDLRVDLGTGCHKDNVPKVQRLPRVQEEPLKLSNVPDSPQKSGAVAVLPSLQSRSKANRLPKSREHETCVHQ